MLVRNEEALTHGVERLPGIKLRPAPGCEWAQLEDDLQTQLLKLAARKEVRAAHTHTHTHTRHVFIPGGTGK